MTKTYTILALLAFTACTTRVEVEYQNVCTEADVPALRECVDTNTADLAENAEPMCVRLICVRQEAWLRHREAGGGPYQTNYIYEAPCAKVTDEDDREICTLAGYEYGQVDSIDPTALAFDN